VSALEAHLALTAAAERRAVNSTFYRHAHISPRPLVVAGYHLAGDRGAVMAVMWGTDPALPPHVVVVPEPRNRALRFEALAEFGQSFVSYLNTFDARDWEGKCVDAPQVIVANGTTAEWLTGIVGRFTRSLRTDGDAPAPPIVPIAGKYLSYLANPMPGSSLLLAATDLLSQHWQTGQLAAENLNLHALLGWVDPPEGLDGPSAARAGELLPPAGPTTDPHWDADHLSGLIKSWNDATSDVQRARVRAELESQIREQLTATWRGTWRALSLVSGLPAAAHVAERWARDRESWTRWHDNVTNDAARFRNIPLPTGDAARLRRVEELTGNLESQMAWDDPLVMARYVSDGHALSGEVVSVDPLHQRLNSNGRRQRSPLLLIKSSLEFLRPTGTVLFLASAPTVKVEIIGREPDGTIRAQVLGGANTRQTMHLLPTVGQQVVLSPFEASQFYRRSHVDEVPWTHQVEEPA
jgi:hypothetical protein